jgi:hypothetical protein
MTEKQVTLLSRWVLPGVALLGTIVILILVGSCKDCPTLAPIALLFPIPSGIAWALPESIAANVVSGAFTLLQFSIYAYMVGAAWKQGRALMVTTVIAFSHLVMAIPVFWLASEKQIETYRILESEKLNANARMFPKRDRTQNSHGDEADVKKDNPGSR